MTVSGSGSYPKWLEDFIVTIANKKEAKSVPQTKTAEINVQDLQKVVWNDETFYVMFDNNTAIVLNEFGNKVTTLENCNTIEQVDTTLNSKQIVAEEVVDSADSTDIEDPFEEELKKISSYLKEADNVNPQPVNDVPNPNPDLNQNPDPNQTQPAPAPVPVSTTAPTPIPDPNQNNQTQQTASLDLPDNVLVSGNILTSSNYSVGIIELESKVAKFEETIAELNKKIEALTQQEYAHTDPGSVYDLNSSIEEIQHFEEAAQQMEQQIELEHQVDISTMEGRISLKDKLLQDINNILEDNLSEEPISDDQESLEDQELNFDDQENPDEIPEVEVELETEVPEEIEETPELPASDDVELEQDNKEEVPGVETEELPTILKEDEVKEDLPVEKKDIRTPKTKDDEITKLNSKDSRIFTNKLCVKCGGNNLVKLQTVGSFVGIVCKECEAEYAVNLKSGDIYNKN